MLTSYRQAIASLPPGRLDRTDLLTDRFLLNRDGRLSIFYAPFDVIEPRARVVLVGITPGWEQMRLAYEAARDAIGAGQSDEDAALAAKASGSFAGMRGRITDWLDALGVAAWLDVGSTAELFDSRSDLLHTTSAIRYPVFVGVGYANYTGHGPRPEQSRLLMALAQSVLVPELEALPDALVVPMGTAVSATLAALPTIDRARCLIGFPHPSGANGHAARHFAEGRNRMTEQVRQLSR